MKTTTTHKMKPGDAVVVKEEDKRKAQTIYEPYVYSVIEIKGSQISAKRLKDGRTITRDPSYCKIPEPFPLRKTENHVSLQHQEMNESQAVTSTDSTNAELEPPKTSNPDMIHPNVENKPANTATKKKQPHHNPKHHHH